jgi:hypothetical protein
MDKLETAADMPIKQLNHEIVNPLLRATKDADGHALLADSNAPMRLCALMHNSARAVQAAAATMLSNMVNTGYSLDGVVCAELRSALMSLRTESSTIRPDHERVFSNRCTRDRGLSGFDLRLSISFSLPSEPLLFWRAFLRLDQLVATLSLSGASLLLPVSLSFRCSCVAVVQVGARHALMTR